MISIKEWMELVDYRITEGSDYCWDCYGPDSYQLSSWNGISGPGGYSFNIVFDNKTQEVYEVEVCDYTNDRAYRMINPDYVKKHAKEAKRNHVNLNEAWDYVQFIDLEINEDFLKKGTAIKNGDTYSTQIQVPLDFTDEELLKYMKLAHQMDITFNELMTRAITDLNVAVEAGLVTKKDAKKFKKSLKDANKISQ